MSGNRPKNYKKPTLILSIVTMTALVVSAAAFSLKQNSEIAVQCDPAKNASSYYTLNSFSSQESQNSQASSTAVRETEHYLITVCDGKIGVYKNGASDPFLTADVDVYLLPEEDLKLLRKGIATDSFMEVKAILEDYE